MRRIVLLLIAAMLVTMLPVASTEASPNETVIPLTWHAEYFDNQYLIGPPKVERNEGTLDYDWGTSAPVEALPPNHFTVRWATRTMLDAGTYRFTVTADDSVKVTVDYNDIVINTINNPSPGATLTADFDLTGGSHYFQVDFRELVGDAYIDATLERLDGQTSPTLPETPAAFVDVYSLRVRSGPGTEYAILGQEQRDTIVNLIGRNSDASWAQVILPDGTRGWMSAAYLDPNVDLSTLPIVITESPADDTPDVPAYDQQIGVVTASVLTVREGPDVSNDVLGYVTRFTPLSIIGRNAAGTWLLILQEDGSLGWVSESYVLTDTNIYALPVLST